MASSPDSVRDRVVLVSGAASGIGRGIARHLAAQGARVACADIQLGEAAGIEGLVPSERPLEAPFRYGGTLSTLVAEIRAAGGEAIGVEADIADPESCEQLLWHVRRLLGPVEVLVNAAVRCYFLPFAEFPPSFWRRAFEVTVYGTFNLARLVLPQMIEQRAGAIVNIGSAAAISSRGPYPDGVRSRSDLGPPTIYGASKAAVERFTQGLAEEVYRHGITVACVSPSNTVESEGAAYLQVRSRTEPPELMERAVALLATAPLDAVTGRVTYSQQILQELGEISDGYGVGIDVPGSGFSQS